MTDMRECEYPECTVTFDVDKEEGIVTTKIETNKILNHYYCSIAHKLT